MWGDLLKTQARTYYPKFSSKHQRHSDREAKPVVTNGVQDSAYLLFSCTSQDPTTGALQGESQQHCMVTVRHLLITPSCPKPDEGQRPVSKTEERTTAVIGPSGHVLGGCCQLDTN